MFNLMHHAQDDSQFAVSGLKPIQILVNDTRLYHLDTQQNLYFRHINSGVIILKAILLSFQFEQFTLKCTLQACLLPIAYRLLLVNCFCLIHAKSVLPIDKITSRRVLCRRERL